MAFLNHHTSIKSWLLILGLSEKQKREVMNGTKEVVRIDIIDKTILVPRFELMPAALGAPQVFLIQLDQSNEEVDAIIEHLFSCHPTSSPFFMRGYSKGFNLIFTL